MPMAEPALAPAPGRPERSRSRSPATRSRSRSPASRSPASRCASRSPLRTLLLLAAAGSANAGQLGLRPGAAAPAIARPFAPALLSAAYASAQVLSRNTLHSMTRPAHGRHPACRTPSLPTREVRARDGPDAGPAAIKTSTWTSTCLSSP